MKKIYSMIMVATLLAAGVAMTGCKKDNNDVQEPAKVQTYKMSITASKGAESTNPANGPKKVLGLDGSTLTATWAAGEVVKVYKEAAEVGSLSAESTGATTTLSGELTGTIEAGDELTLKFLSPSYASQDGTLEYISANCDYATASTTVAAVDAGTIYTESTANFVNQQAIVKLTLKKKADDTNLSVSSLTVSDGTNDYTVTPASTTNVLFVAIPATNTVNLSTTIGAVTYSYDKTAADLLVAGQYYEIGVKMWREVNLASISANTTLLNGDKVIGALGGNYQISIADGASINLYNATITYASNGANWAGITCVGDATIVLGDGTTNTVVSGLSATNKNNYPGIYVPENKTLTINGNTGTLNASCGQDELNGRGAGIGTGMSSGCGNCGNIIINGGIINATGGIYCAGIGGAFEKSCGDITINGGTVTAIGGGVQSGDRVYGAGIGTGAEDGYGGLANRGCGDITITGGTVTATGGQYAAGIGTGYHDAANYYNVCGDITITGGTVTATGGEKAAGIGTGYSESGNSTLNVCGNITITSGVTSVTATKGSGSEIYHSIGKSRNGTCTSVTIGGTQYWGWTGSIYDYMNGGGSYLTISPLVYPAP